MKYNVITKCVLWHISRGVYVIILYISLYFIEISFLLPWISQKGSPTVYWSTLRLVDLDINGIGPLVCSPNGSLNIFHWKQNDICEHYFPLGWEISLNLVLTSVILFLETGDKTGGIWCLIIIVDVISHITITVGRCGPFAVGSRFWPLDGTMNQVTQKAGEPWANYEVYGHPRRTFEIKKSLRNNNVNYFMTHRICVIFDILETRWELTNNDLEIWKTIKR